MLQNKKREIKSIIIDYPVYNKRLSMKSNTLYLFSLIYRFNSDWADLKSRNNEKFCLR